MFNNLKFPYFNMQQLNLDWIMDKVATFPEIITAPALTQEDIDGVALVIDSKDEYIPVGISFLLIGTPQDDNTKRAACLIFKMDLENKIVFTMTLANSIGFGFSVQYEGVWAHQ